MKRTVGLALLAGLVVVVIGWLGSCAPAKQVPGPGPLIEQRSIYPGGTQLDALTVPPIGALCIQRQGATWFSSNMPGLGN